MRNTQIHGALSSAAELRSLVFRLRAPVDPAATPPATEVRDMPLPASSRARIALRARGLLGRRHPFLQHLVESDCPAVLADRLAGAPVEIVVLTYPCFGPFVDAAVEAGSRVIVDIGEARAPIARQRLRETRSAGRWLRALGDLAVAGAMEKSLSRAHQFWTASPAEERWLPRHFVGRLRVVPNTLDLARYPERRLADPLPPRVGYVGSLDYPPNAVAAARLVDGILPRLRAARPEARAIVIGRRPSRTLVERAQAAQGWELRADVADPLADLAEAGVLVAPLTAGGGTKYKILEAAASNIPVVTTTIGLQGLDLEPGRDLLVADSDEGIAAAVVSLWTEPGLAARLAASARARVRELHGPQVLDAAVAAALHEVLAAPAAGSPA